MATSTDVGTRAVQFASGSNVGCITELLAARREEILDRWLEAAAAQPWHRGRRERAVAHHIPRLFDALLELWRRLAAGSDDPTPLLNDPAVLAAAEAHARDRFDLGLQPQEVIAEFRLLRQEIWRVLYLHLMDSAPNGKVLGAEVLMHDTLDGTVSVALTALLQRAEEAREDFLATLSHDMRHPMTAIKSSLQLAERALARPEPDLAHVAESLRRAEAATDQMLTLLGRLLHASRFALGSLALHVELVDLRRLLDAAVKRLDPATAGRVQLEVPARIDATGRWDPAALGQVLDNLLSNAAKYAPGQSPIKVAVRAVANAVHLSVRDGGLGLTREELTRLFRRFSRTQRATERRIQGLGLGLYQSRGIVEAHGGRIWAESDGPSQGSTFHVRLPRAPQRATGPAGPQEQEEGATRMG